MALRLLSDYIILQMIVLNYVCSFATYDTVKGELSVAKFLVKREPFFEGCGCARLAGCTPPLLPVHSPLVPPFPTRQSQPVLATIMAPHTVWILHSIF